MRNVDEINSDIYKIKHNIEINDKIIVCLTCEFFSS